MTKRSERLPPSAAKVFVLGALALAAAGGYRLFLSKLLPFTAASNQVPQTLAVAAGCLPAAFFLYWLGRLRYSSAALNNLPGRPLAAALCALGLGAAAACLQWQRPPAPWDATAVLPRLAGLAMALFAAACEELGFRGTLFVAALDWGGKRGALWAILFGSLAYALYHWSFQGHWDLPFAAAVGLALGVARLRGATLLTLVAAHALMDGVDAVWLSPSLALGNWTSLAAAGVALLLAGGLWLLPRAPGPALPKG
jgi:membrane protease YdiL (CAAX protease family)